MLHKASRRRRPGGGQPPGKIKVRRQCLIIAGVLSQIKMIILDNREFCCIPEEKNLKLFLFYQVFKEHPLMSVYPSDATTVNGFQDDHINQPNTALLSLVLMMGTFFLAFFLRKLRNSRFLGGKVPFLHKLLNMRESEKKKVFSCQYCSLSECPFQNLSMFPGQKNYW